MDKNATLKLLQKVQQGTITPESAALQLKLAPFEELGYAKIDCHRAVRQGVPEVIYGAGKTPQQIAGIVTAMIENGGENILITRMEESATQTVSAVAPLEYYSTARLGVANPVALSNTVGNVVIATGGTSDMPVAEEAALVAEYMGNNVTRLYDVGVAGLHRLLANLPTLMEAKVIVAIAGMEGALASVIGGLVDCPVIAVPTSVGYGASLGGVTALLSMLNSCASGVSVVNIDNGFGAGYLASMINHIGE
ncbi:MAG: nickel pincer cofactor biosynthesis protein LarB [Oscillospiraceae bacterium]|nr:nickel pincer cofactor biosynthesis protein LarB [Oscillospiraceae bacterium]